MNHRKLPTIPPELTAELRNAHQIMQVVDILAEHPELTVITHGKIWRYADMLRISMRYAYLAKKHGFNVEPFRRWYNREADTFKRYGIQWQND